MSTDIFFNSPIDNQENPLQNSNASSSVVMFESAILEAPNRTTTPFRSSEIDTDEPLDRSQFAVYEENLPEWKFISDSHKSERQALHKHIADRLQELRDIEEWFEKANADFHNRVEEGYVALSDELGERQSMLEQDKKKYDREEQVMKEVRKFQHEKVKLNVGGQQFVTSRTTLTRDPNSLLANLFYTQEPDEDGSYFLDRDSTYFRLVLNYLRDLKIPQNALDDPRIMDELMQEAQYYRINDLLKLRWMDLPVVTQDDLYRMYPLSPSSNEPTLFNLQGKKLVGLDFSNYHIDPSSDFSGSNLENCRFKDAWFIFDFTHQVNFTNTYLRGVRFPEPGTQRRAPGKKKTYLRCGEDMENWENN
ncbi:hypothetical protein BDB00DRAFT_827923 [Zychaea mexicana]|uniref:uncharacterized protein n=1 Tax=Zychaea mexicana TaxID=64656 RepID=UPI0022FEAB9B|nr:uncharacterized protein BDB00DRAFT_827923 [Zychaea mexicana]KAI9492550.1 hypothetical protein BDB00DRAFT_827923 [Zychaea mexicana]